MIDSGSKYPQLPKDTAHTAKSIFNISNLYLVIGDQLEEILSRFDLDLLDPTSERTIRVVTMYTLIAIFQFAEGLPDRQAADATRTRMDWKYALHLPLNYPGLQPLSLCRYRQRLRLNPKGQVVFFDLVEEMAEIGLVSRREIAQRDANTLIRLVCNLTRLDLIAQSIHLVLEALAAENSEWLRSIALPHWYKRYAGTGLAESIPKSGVEQVALARALGADAQYLLWAASDRDLQAQWANLEIRKLERVFRDQFYVTEEVITCKEEIDWRSEKCATCSLLKDKV